MRVLRVRVRRVRRVRLVRLVRRVRRVVALDDGDGGLALPLAPVVVRVRRGGRGLRGGGAVAARGVHLLRGDEVRDDDLPLLLHAVRAAGVRRARVLPTKQHVTSIYVHFMLALSAA